VTASRRELPLPAPAAAACSGADAPLIGAVAGTGLGLPIARRTIEQFGGTLSIDSVEGAGTTARVSLPLGSHA